MGFSMRRDISHCSLNRENASRMMEDAFLFFVSIIFWMKSCSSSLMRMEMILDFLLLLSFMAIPLFSCLDKGGAIRPGKDVVLRYVTISVCPTCRFNLMFI